MIEPATREIVQVGAEERKITISFNDVKRYLCPKASDAEIGLFLKVCQSQGLNPFAREIYLVKYSEDEAAAIIIAIDAFLKAAETCDQYNGHDAGIILKGGKTREPEFREGTFLLDEEKDDLAGGWAKVYRKDRDKPFYAAVNIAEYRKFTRVGQPTRFWREMPATMIRNVALRHALKEAFPNRFAGMYTTAEVAEGEMPVAYEKNGEPDWKKWWARQKEKGLSEDDVHRILNISSIKEDWLEKGRTLEEAEETINDALVRKTDTAAPVEASKPEETHAMASAKPKRDPESIRTINELVKACFEDFKFQPKDVYAELNVKSASEISKKPAECYRRIAAVRSQPSV